MVLPLPTTLASWVMPKLYLWSGMPLEVEISFDALAGELVVTNNIQRKLDSVSSTGIGLENIKKRFQYFTQRPVKIIQDLERFQVALPTITL